MPAQTVRAKASLSHLPGQKSTNVNNAPAKKVGTVGVKAGAKRTALGGVVSNSQKDETEEDAKKPGKLSCPVTPS